MNNQPHKINQINTKIENLVKHYKNTYFEEKLFYERQALDKIKSDSKYFYSYAKKFKKIPSLPSILIDKSDNIVTDPQRIADMLQDQFKSVFSVPKKSPYDDTADIGKIGVRNGGSI